ncbi:MAG: hypothetical protein J6V50_02335, partial [Clostridia bacterium]|nr:hypothetical protein [Clostridia bacterium]
KSLSEKLSVTLPYVSKIEITREFPTTLKIKVYEAYEEKAFYRDSLFYSADKNGKILNEYYERPDGLPITIAAKNDRLEKGYNYAAENETGVAIESAVFEFAKSRGINVTLVNATDIYRSYFIVDDSVLVLLGSSTYLDRKLDFLPKTLKSIGDANHNVIDISGWSPDNNEAISYEKDINSYFVFK